MSKTIIIKILIAIIFIIVLSSTICLPKSHALGDIFSSGKSFLEVGNSIDKTLNTTVLEGTSDYIYNILLAIAVVVAVIVAMVLGIQFMAASADEKAKVKEALMPFVVGCIVVFGAFTIWKVAVNIGNNAEKSIKGSTPEISGITWEHAQSAKEFIDNGGDLSEVPNNKLYAWYAQLSRMAGNKGAMISYYNTVKAECEERGFFDENAGIRRDVVKKDTVYYYNK